MMLNTSRSVRKNVQDGNENMSAMNAVTPPLTLILIGNKNSIEIGSKNILLDHDQEIHEKEFSSRLYDLLGRQISVINLLGFPRFDMIPVIPEHHAFILLVSNDQHENQYTSGLQWLEKTLGKEHSSHVMTVVTQDDSDENSENELQNLKAKSSFSEKRYHTCTRSMMDINEIITLLEKIDAMVFESRRMTEGKETNLDETLRTADETESPDEAEDAFEYFMEEENRISRLAEVNPGQYQSSEKGQEKESENKLKETTEKDDSEVKDDRGAKCMDGHEKKDEAETGTKHDGVKDSEANDNDEGEKTDSSEPSQESKSFQSPPSTAPPTKSDTLDMDGNRNKPTRNTFEDNQNKRQKETEKLLRRLHLQGQHQRTLTSEYFVQIGLPIKKTEIFETDLVCAFLQRLMMLDYRARYIQQNHVHPMDVQMAAFHCSDSFLKQKMITKLSHCQYALLTM
ncbi:PREDICTED: uncharacterized protein LOC106915470 [Poecilia mexicana]|uniref:uncharacterized protein LOC106915470 n=1 Tax=Poecilia mexicana TaxID=48701 RepID=UPI00072E25C9|nr:PREDICTED: uncharacterized protein LOC106915470 [Poecilia mexicana]